MRRAAGRKQANFRLPADGAWNERRWHRRTAML
jgi:hypothetical protein